MSIFDSNLFKATIGDVINGGAQSLYNTIFKHVPASHEKQMALSSIEQAASWAIKALEVSLPSPVVPIAEVASDVVQEIAQPESETKSAN